MDSQQPRRSTSPFEYFLYAAIITETALAALVYKSVFRNAELARLSAYFAIFYFAFLGWAIAQLNMLHHERQPKDRPMEPTGPPVSPAGDETSMPEDTRPVLGLTAAQLVIVVVVFATAIATFSWALRVVR